MFDAATTLPIRNDVDIGALFDRDRDLEAPIKRRLFLTYICRLRHPTDNADELNRKYAITRSAKDVDRYLKYLSVLDRRLGRAYDGVDLSSPLDIIAHMPDWIRYGSTVEVFRDLKNLKYL